MCSQQVQFNHTANGFHYLNLNMSSPLSPLTITYKKLTSCEIVVKRKARIGPRWNLRKPEMTMPSTTTKPMQDHHKLWWVHFFGDGVSNEWMPVKQS